MFLGRIPGQGCVPSNDFPVLSFQNGQGITNIITLFMELCNRKGALAGSVDQIHGFEGWFGEERANILMILGNLAQEPRNLVAEAGHIGGNRHFIFLSFSHVEILDVIKTVFNIFESLLALSS